MSAGYAALVVLLGLLAVAVPAASSAAFAVASAAPAAAIGLGLRRHMPGAPLAWLFLAAGYVAWGLGAAIWDTDAQPSIADAAFVTGYAAWIAGLLHLVRARTARADRTGLIDALIVATGLAVLTWVLVVEPYANRSAVPIGGRVVAASYPILDIVLVALLARLTFLPGWRERSYQLLFLGFLAQLVTNTWYAVSVLTGEFRLDHPATLGWYVAFAAVGAAALVRGMDATTLPATGRPLLEGRRRLLLLGLAALIPPVALVVQSLAGQLRGVPVIASIAAVLFVLALVRASVLTTEVREREQQAAALRRERDMTELLRVTAQAANEAVEVEDAFRIVLRSVCEHIGWPVGHAYLRARDEMAPTRAWYLDDPARWETLVAVTERTRFRPGHGTIGDVMRTGQPIWIEDVLDHPDFVRGQLTTRLGVRAGFAFPVLVADEVVGALEFFSDVPAPRDDELLANVRTTGAQLGRVVERVRSREALAQRGAELARSNRDLQDFASIVSHDLQAPLRTVTGYLELLELEVGDELGDEARGFIEAAVGGAQRMRTLIEDLLAYARVGSGRLDPTPTDADVALDRALDVLGPAIGATDARIERAPLPTLYVEESQLVQLFQNLVGNALKFHGEEPPVVRISAERVEGAWRIDVADEGIGLSPRDAERIFDVFQRLHPREHYEGTGVGLAICKRIVERHGGSIAVASEPGRGATFSCVLPGAARGGADTRAEGQAGASA